LLNRALAIRTKISGRDHPDTAVVLSNLERVAQAHGDRAKARALFEHAVHIWERVLGPNHLRVASGLANLGASFSEQKEYREAERAYRRALQISESAHSGNDPGTARDLNNLAYCLRNN
jgi:tetratricopeptide (TPR) repeat protein